MAGYVADLLIFLNIYSKYNKFLIGIYKDYKKFISDSLRNSNDLFKNNKLK